MVGSPQADTIIGDGAENRLDGGVGNDTLESGGGGGEAFGGPGSDNCSGFTVENSCGPETGPPPGVASVILNQGLDGSSLVVQGSQGPDDLRVADGAGGWTVTDSDPIFAGEGCANAPGNADAVSCTGDVGLALIVVTGGAGNDDIVDRPQRPDQRQGAGQRQRRQRHADRRRRATTCSKRARTTTAPTTATTPSIGNGGNDVLYADPGADQLNGGPGDDLLVSSVLTCQGHSFDGGAGDDTVSYARSNAALRVELGGTGGPAGCATPDQVLGDNESLEGSDGPDVLIGDNSDNSFLGHLGADTFIGKGGNDFIDAIDGQHDKQIDCGPGNDEVVKDHNDPAPVSC